MITWYRFSLLVGMVLILMTILSILQARPGAAPALPFNVYRSGGNCVYVVGYGPATGIAVVPNGIGGC